MLKINKIFLLVLSISVSLLANEGKPKEIKVEENIQKVKPISVPGIRYNKSLVKYSLIDYTKTGYIDYVKSQKINGYLLKKLYNRIDNPKSIVVSAYAYDYGHNRPDLAENFYNLFEKNKISFPDKLRKMDFLLRTGRVSEIKNYLVKTECIQHFKYSSKCFYYLGVATYLENGDNRNNFLSLSKKKIKKAKEIYYNKDVN